METFTSVDLQKRTGDVQRAALKGPVTITVHGTPRTVMLPVEQFENLSSGRPNDRWSPVALIRPDLINKRMKNFTPEEVRDITSRAGAAVEGAERALTVLDTLGIKAWVIGSLARGTFNTHSDVDFVVEIPPGRRHFIFLILEEAMKNMPFDLVPFDQIPEADREVFMKGALDASGFRSRFTETGATQEGTR